MPGTTRYSATFDRTYEEEDRVDPSPPPNARRSRSQSWQANSGLDGGRPYTPLGIRPPAQRSSSTDNGPKGPEHIPTRTVAKTAVKAHSNPFQFVKVGTCPLYRKAEEQLKKAKDVKKPDVLKEEEEEWQSNLDSWKSRRRKMSEDVFRRQEEIKQFEQEEQIAQVSQKKTKTFSEMVESRAHRGRALSLCLISSPMELQNWEFESSSLKNGSCSTFSGESEENSTVNSEDEGVSLKGIVDKTSQNDTQNNHHRTNGDSHIEKNGSELDAHNGDYDKLADHTTNNLQMKPKECSYIDSGLESISSNRAGDTPDSGSDFSQDSGSSIDCGSPRTGVNILEEFSSKPLQVSSGYEIIVKLCLNEKSQDFGFTYLDGKDQGEVIVASVLEGSKADSSALHLGDQILTIDGKDVSSKKHIEIAAMMQKARERGEISLLLWRHTKDNGVTNGFNHSEKQCNSTVKLSKSENQTSKSKPQQYEKSIESENEMYVDDFEELQRQSELMTPNSKSEINVQANGNVSPTSVPSIKDKIPKSLPLISSKATLISSKAKVNITNDSIEESPKNGQSMNLDVNNENQTRNGVKVNRIRKKGVYALNVSAVPNQNSTEKTSVNSLFPLSPVTELPSPADDTKTLSSSLSSDTNTPVLDYKKEMVNKDVLSSNSKENYKCTSSATVAANNVNAIPAIELKDNSFKKDETKNDSIVPSSSTITKNEEKNTSLGSPQNEKSKFVLKKVKKVKKESDKPPATVTESITSKILDSDDLKTSSPQEDKDVSEIIPSSIVKSKENTSAASPKEEKPKPNIILRKVKKVKKASVSENESSFPQIIKEVDANSNCITSDLNMQNLAKENLTKETECSSANEKKKITTNEIKNKKTQTDNKVLSTGITAISPVTQITVPKDKISITTADTKIQSIKHVNSELRNTTSPSTEINLSKIPAVASQEEHAKQNTSQLKTIPKPKNANGQKVNTSPAKPIEEYKNLIGDSLNVVFQSEPKNTNPEIQSNNVKSSQISNNKFAATAELVPDILPVEKVAEEMEKLILEQLEEEERAKEHSSGVQVKSSVYSPEHLLTAPPKLAEPPKEKPPPPPSTSEGSQKDASLTRMNSTKRIKKEIYKRRSNFLGIDNAEESLACNESSIPPPPALEEILKAEMELDRQSRLKIESASTERLNLEENEILQKEREIIESLESEERHKQLLNDTEDLKIIPNSCDGSLEEDRIQLLKNERKRLDAEKLLNEEQQQLQLIEEKQLREREEFIRKQEADKSAVLLSDPSLSVAANVPNLSQPSISSSLSADTLSSVSLSGACGDGKTLTSNSTPELSEVKSSECDEKKVAQKPAVPPKPLKKKEAIRKERERLRQEQEALQREREEHRQKLLQEQEELMKHQKSHAPDVPVSRLGPLPPLVPSGFSPPLTSTSMNATPNVRESASFPSRSHHGAPNGAAGSINAVELMSPPVVRQSRVPPPRKAAQNEAWGQQKVNENIPPISVLPEDEIPNKAVSYISSDLKSNASVSSNTNEKLIKNEPCMNDQMNVENQKNSETEVKKNISKSESPNKTASSTSRELDSNVKIINSDEKQIKSEQSVNAEMSTESQKKGETKEKKIIRKSESLNKTASRTSRELDSNVKIINADEKQIKNEQSAEMSSQSQKKGETKVKKILSKGKSSNKIASSTSYESNINVKIADGEKQINNDQSVNTEMNTESQKKSETGVNKFISKKESPSNTTSNKSSESNSNVKIVNANNKQSINTKMDNENQERSETKVKNKIFKSETASHISSDSQSSAIISNDIKKLIKNEQSVNAELGSQIMKMDEIKVEKIISKSKSPSEMASNTSCESNSTIVNADTKPIINNQNVKKLVNSETNLKPNKTVYNVSCVLNSNPNIINAYEKQNKTEQSVNVEEASEHLQKSEIKEKIFFTKCLDQNKNSFNASSESNLNAKIVNSNEKQITNEQRKNPEVSDKSQQKNETNVKGIMSKSVSANKTAHNTSNESNSNLNFANIIDKQVMNEQSVNTQMSTKSQIKSDKIKNIEKIHNKTASYTCEINSDQYISNVSEKNIKNDIGVNVEMGSENQQKCETKAKENILKSPIKKNSNTSSMLNTDAKNVNANKKQIKNEQSVNNKMGSENQQKSETKGKEFITESKLIQNKNASNTSCESNPNAQVINVNDTHIKSKQHMNVEFGNENQQKNGIKMKNIPGSGSPNKTTSNTTCATNSTHANANEKQNKNELVNVKMGSENQQKGETKEKKIIIKSANPNATVSGIPCLSNSNVKVVNASEKQIKSEQSVNADMSNENHPKNETKVKKISTKSKRLNKNTSNTSCESNSNAKIVNANEKHKNEQSLNTEMDTERPEKSETKVNKIISKSESLNKTASSTSCESNSSGKIVNANEKQIKGEQSVNAEMSSKNQQNNETEVITKNKSLNKNTYITSCESNSNAQIINVNETHIKNKQHVNVEFGRENQQKNGTEVKNIPKSESLNKTISKTSCESNSNPTIVNAKDSQNKNEQVVNAKMESKNQQKGETKVKRNIKNVCPNSTVSDASCCVLNSNEKIINAIEKQIKNEKSVNAELGGKIQQKIETKVKKIISKNENIDKTALNASSKSSLNATVIDAIEEQIKNDESVNREMGSENQQQIKTNSRKITIKSENSNETTCNTSCDSNLNTVNANDKQITNEVSVNVEIGSEKQQNSDTKVKKKIIKSKIHSKSVVLNTLCDSNSNINIVNESERQIKNEHCMNTEVDSEKQQKNETKVKKKIIKRENPNKTDINISCELNSNANIISANEIEIQNVHTVNAEIEGESQQKSETKMKKKITKHGNLTKTASNPSCESNSNPNIANDTNMRTSEPSINTDIDGEHQKKNETKVKKKIIKKKVLSVRKQNQDSLTESRYNQNHWLIQEAEMRRISELQERQLAGQLPCSQTHLAEDDVCSPARVPVIPPTHNQHLNFAVQDKMWNYTQANMPLKKYPPPVVKEPLHTIYSRETVTHQPPTKPSRVVPMERQEQMLSVSGRKRCSHCNEELGRGAAMIIESLQLYYHIHCFQCCVCQAQLGNGSCGTDVRVRNNKLHCHNCYSNDEAGLKFSQV